MGPTQLTRRQRRNWLLADVVDIIHGLLVGYSTCIYIQTIYMGCVVMMSGKDEKMISFIMSLNNIPLYIAVAFGIGSSVARQLGGCPFTRLAESLRRTVDSRFTFGESFINYYLTRWIKIPLFADPFVTVALIVLFVAFIRFCIGI